MFFRKLRSQVKVIVVIVAITFVGGMLFVGGSGLFGNDQGQPAQAAIATVNGTPISYYEFQQAYIAQLQQTEQQLGRLSGRLYEAIKYQTLDSLVGQIVLNEELNRRSIQVPSTEVDERLNALKAEFPSDDDFKRALEGSGLTEQHLRTYMEQEIQVEKLREEVAGTIEITDEEIRQAYEEVTVSHILVRPRGEDENDEEAWDMARAEIEELKRVADDYPFDYLARLYSEDTESAREGGSIGSVKRGDTVAAFDEAIFDMEPGEIRGPVRTEFGYHLIKVSDRLVAEGEDFEAVKERVENQLRQDKKQAIISDWFDGLKAEADVDIDDKQLVAHGYRQREDFETAVEYYQLALEEQPDNGYLYSSLGDVYRELGEYEKAVENYELAVEKISNDAYMFYVLAETYKQAGQPEKAGDAYLRASQLAPNDYAIQVQAMNNLSMLARPDDVAEVEERLDAIHEQRMAAEQPQQQDVLDLEELLSVEDEFVEEPDTEDSVVMEPSEDDEQMDDSALELEIVE